MASTEALLTHCREFIERYPAPTYWVGFSGGLDSAVLLHLLSRCRHELPFTLQAVHVHHGLSQHADAWVKHCEAMCHTLDVALTVFHVQAKAVVGASPESYARDARYQVLTQCLKRDEVLFTAHHQDDQAETFLLQLTRGAGPKGLSAMPESKALGMGLQVRPLLAFTRLVLEQYAREHHLHWVDDESNLDASYTRNFLRHHIIAPLRERWPTVTETIARSAKLCAEAQTLIDEIASEDYTRAKTAEIHVLNMNHLKTLSVTRLTHALRFWFALCGVRMPPSTKMASLLVTMFQAAEDRHPLLVWGGYELRRYREQLFLLPNLAVTLAEEAPILKTSWVYGCGIKPQTGVITIRNRVGGEKIRLPRRSCHHLLKHCLQDWGIPPWERDRLPLVYCDDELIAVPGYVIAEGYEARADEWGWQFRCK